jgi:hypothetical protein
MEAISPLCSLAWFVVNPLWILTFVGPTRRAMARTVLAPRRIYRPRQSQPCDKLMVID